MCEIFPEIVFLNHIIFPFLQYLNMLHYIEL